MTSDMTAAELFEVVKPLMGTRMQPGDVAYDHDYPEWWNPVKVDGLSVDHAALIWQGHLVGQLVPERIHPPGSFNMSVGDDGRCIKNADWWVSGHSKGQPTLLHALVSAAVSVLAKEGA